MYVPRFAFAALALIGGLSLNACTDGYGYSGVSLGYAGGGYHGGGYGDPYWGWNNGFYYPGNGNFVYDRYRRPYRWNGAQQAFWQGRRSGWRGGPNYQIRDNWRDFNRDRRADTRAFVRERRDDRNAFRNGQVTRDAFRADRRQDNRAFNREFRQDRRQLNRANRAVRPR